MKYIVLVLQVFLLASAQGQVSHFSINGRINYVHNSIRTSINQLDATSTQKINDSMSIRKELHIIRKQQKSYTPKIGYDVSGNIYFKLFHRLSVKTGLGLNYLSFDLNSKTLASETVTLSIDTIESKNDGITSFFTSCDSFKNSIADLGKVKVGKTQDIFSLKIPLELEYEIVKSKLYIRVGAFMQTPLFALAKREYITTRSEMVDGRKICEFVKVAEKNTSGNNLNNFHLGMTAELAYRIYRNFCIEMGISKQLGNVYTKEEFQIYPADNEDFRPLEMSFGVSYAFGFSGNHAQTTSAE